MFFSPRLVTQVWKLKGEAPMVWRGNLLTAVKKKQEVNGTSFSRTM